MSRSSTTSVANPPSTLRDPRWARVLSRDKRADGQFWYSVSTTGIYCRPSCGSRTANPKNVSFHDSVASARAAGFRACRRCNPDGPSIDAHNAARITTACRLIEDSEDTPLLADLADAVDLSPYHFHRLFKKVTGVTPRAYAAARRADRMRKGLGSARSVTEAIYDAGFSSSSRFYERATSVLGMTPSTYRAGGDNERLLFAVAQCSLGSILVASSKKGVAAILLGDDPDALVKELQDQFAKATLVGGDAAYERLVARVVGFVEAPHTGLDLPLDVRGTAFQQRVWQALRKIPPGKTASYADLARRIGSPTATRAVAQALAANKLAVVVPCHRIIRHDGGLSGYRWGAERKQRLLDREATP